MECKGDACQWVEVDCGVERREYRFRNPGPR